jgi:hypothetical protein
MGLFRDFILGQPLEKKGDKNSEMCDASSKPAEKKSEPRWASGKTYHPEDFIKFIGIDDTVNHRMFTKGDFGQYREQLTNRLKEIAATKGRDQTFSREDAARIARELHGKSDNISHLIEKAINNALN